MPGKRLISIAIMIFIIYAIANDKYTQSKVSEFVKSTKNVTNQSANSQNNQANSAGTFANLAVHPSHDDSIIANFVAKILNNALNTPEGQQVAKQIINELPDNFSIPQEFREINVHEEKAGSGDNIECGQKISINYAILTSDGKVIENNLDVNNPTQVIVGNREIISAIDLVVLGMKVGGSKKVLLSPYFIDNDAILRNKVPKGYHGFLTLLVNVVKAGSLPTSPLKLRIFTENMGKDSPAKCGDSVNINYKIFRLDGTELFNSIKSNATPLSVRIGSPDIPFAFNKALEYMNIGSERIIIVPPKLLNNIDSKRLEHFFPKDLKLPHEIIIVEIMRL